MTKFFKVESHVKKNKDSKLNKKRKPTNHSL